MQRLRLLEAILNLRKQIIIKSNRLRLSVNIERPRTQFSAGCQVALDKMEDPQAPPVGTLGVVWGVDDTGTILVAWANGSGLNVVYGADKYHRI